MYNVTNEDCSKPDVGWYCRTLGRIEIIVKIIEMMRFVEINSEFRKTNGFLAQKKKRTAAKPIDKQ